MSLIKSNEYRMGFHDGFRPSEMPTTAIMTNEQWFDYHNGFNDGVEALNDTSQQISDAELKAVGFESELEDAESEVRTLESDIDDLHCEKTDLQNKIDDLEEELKELKEMNV